MRWIVFFGVCFFPSASEAGQIVPPDPWEIIHTAREFGEAGVERDNMSDPMISGALNVDDDVLKLPYEIGFYGCQLGRDCQTIVFRTQLGSAEWDEEPPHLDLFDAWNRRKLIGRAFWSLDGKAILEHPVAMNAGLPKETLLATFQVWKTAVMDYKDFLDFPEP